MGRIAKLLSFTRVLRNGAKISDVKTDPGGGANITGNHFSSPGDDSPPLPGDYVINVPTGRTGVFAVVGYIDINNEQKAGAGDKRIYARDSDGNEVCQIWLKSDKSVLVSNSSGSIQLQSGGDCVINGVKIDTNGNIETAGNVTASDGEFSGIAFSTHSHPQGNDSDGNIEDNVGPPV